MKIFRGLGQKEDLTVSFAPKTVKVFNEVLTATVRVSVLNNQFDQYILKLKAVPFECDAIIDVDHNNNNIIKNNNQIENGNEYTNINKKENENIIDDEFTMTEINLAESPGNVCSSTYTFLLKSRSEHNLKFDFTTAEGTPNVLFFNPSGGHLGPNNFRDFRFFLDYSQEWDYSQYGVTYK